MINKDYMLHLDLFIDDCVAEFYFNDIPVRKMDSSKEQFHSMVAHHLLLNGNNTMEILVWPGDTPANCRQFPHSVEPNKLLNSLPKVCMRLMKYPIGAYAGQTASGEILMELNWVLDKNSRVDRMELYPFSATITDQLNSPFGQWNWLRPERIDLDDNRDELIKVITDIHQCFEQGNGRKMVQYCAPHLRDMGLALPAYGQQSFINDLEKDVSANRGRKDWVKPLDIESLDLRVCGAGRLVQVIDKSWQEAVTTLPQSDGERYRLPIMLGKYEGQWLVFL